MAAYPLLTVMASGGSLAEAMLWMTVALGALGLAFLVSYRWGHHVGRAIGHPGGRAVAAEDPRPGLHRGGGGRDPRLGGCRCAAPVRLVTGRTADRGPRRSGSPLRRRGVLPVHRLRRRPGRPVAATSAALALAAVTALTKVVTGPHAARRDGAADQAIAGEPLIARGGVLWSSSAWSAPDRVSAIATPYVFVLAIAGPLIRGSPGSGAVVRTVFDEQVFPTPRLPFRALDRLGRASAPNPLFTAWPGAPTPDFQ